jgi:hypothetical protein
VLTLVWLFLAASPLDSSGAPSADLLAFPGALASGPLPLLDPRRRTGCSVVARRPRSSFVPENGWSRCLGQHYWPGCVGSENG